LPGISESHPPAKRPLWAGGPEVGCVGFGGWGIGGRTPGDTSYGNTNDETSTAALRHAAERGITLFDTAPAYGEGRSERLIGQALKDRRASIVLCSKVGVSTWQDQPDFSPDTIQASIEGSLNRLETDWLDVIYLHSPAPELLLAADPVLERLDALRARGIIGTWGISCKSPTDALQILERRPVDLFQVNLNMMDLRAAECGLLETAERKGIGIVARTPLNFGFLTGAVDETTEFTEGDHRRAWSAEQIAIWSQGARRLMALTGAAPGDEACVAAIRFCLSFPSVSSVLPGALTPQEADVHARAGGIGPLPRDIVEEIVLMNRQTRFFVRAASTPV